jgi:hypothetical protein
MKKMMKEYQIPKDPGSVLNDAQKTFIANKVNELGSVEAVTTFYHLRDAVSAYAVELAEAKFGTKVIKRKKTIDIPKDLPKEETKTVRKKRKIASIKDDDEE